MAKSWLANAKSIHDLDACVAIHPAGSYDEAREERASAKWLAKRAEPLPVEPQFQGFFGSQMHDSWVIAIERNQTRLRVRLDCIHADIFALNLASELGREPVRSQWPVDLVLLDTSL